MDLYLGNCYKIAQAAAKAAASSLTADREQCDSVSGGQSVVVVLLLLPVPGLDPRSEGGAGRRKRRRSQQGGGGSLTFSFRLPGPKN